MDLIKKLEKIRLVSDDVLMLFDVRSLFPSVQLDNMLINLEKWLTSLSFSKFEISEYVQLLNFTSFIMPSNLERIFIYKIMV